MGGSSEQGEHPLHVLLQRAGNVYVAQCIEHDIAAEGTTLEDAKRAFAETIICHVLAARRFDRPLFWSVPAPPTEVRETWHKLTSEGGKPELLDIPAFTIRRRTDGGDATPEAAPSAELLVV